MKVGQRVLTSLGEGVFLGWECYDLDSKFKEVNWRIEEDCSNKYTTERKAVKLDSEHPHLKNNIGYFFTHDKVEII